MPDASLRIDQDGDGLTDVVEKRLGTNPLKADSDGDGDPDGVDPWPNAAPRPLSDAEEVLAAILEARYHFSSNDGPAIFFAPKGLKPFEMVGWNGPLLWQEQVDKRWSTPLEQCYEQGVGFISFRGSSQSKTPASWEESVLSWNSDRTEARTTISTYYGGRSGNGYTAVVRKIDGHWVVVAMQRAYVS